MLIRDIIQTIETAVASHSKQETVDTFKYGNPDVPVRAVAVTFMATLEILEKAADAGANLIITHEPTFYNHQDETAWLENDPVFLAKKELLDRHGLVLWRFHDGLHRRRPDGILEGMVEKLGWGMPEDPKRPNLCHISPLSLRDLALHCRKSLGIGPVRVVGDPDMMCSQIGLQPGACGGRRQIDVLRLHGAEVIVCGESAEWETCEYIRDANFSGIPKGLIVLGHANSEEAGMAYCADWLRTILPPAIPLHYFPASNPFQSI